MDDLGERLRRAVDPVQPIDLAEIQEARTTHLWKRPTLAVVIIAALIVVATVGFISLRHGHSGQTVQIVGDPDGVSPRSVSATHDGVTVRVVLSRSTVMQGTDVTGHLIVTNRTGRSIAPPGGMLCPDLAFQMVVFNRSHPAESGFIQPGCLPGFAFEPGTTTETIKTRTDLPVGRYAVRVAWDRMRLPVPRDLHITIQGPSSGVPYHAALPAIAPAVIRAAGLTDVTVSRPPRAARPKVTERSAEEVAERNSHTGTPPIAAQLEDLTNVQFPKGDLVWAVQSRLPKGFVDASGGPVIKVGAKRRIGPIKRENVRLDFVDAETGTWLEGLTFYDSSQPS